MQHNTDRMPECGLRRDGFFLAWAETLSMDKNAGAALIETPAHTCRFAQSYSSWSCSPAELHYASDCATKIGRFLRFSKKNTEKLQEWEIIHNFAPHQPEL